MRRRCLSSRRSRLRALTGMPRCAGQAATSSGAVINRRGFLSGLVGVLAAPAIVRVASIMPVKALPPELVDFDYGGLVAITRKAFIPRLFVHVYARPPWLDIDWEAPAFEFEAIEAVRA